MSIPFPWQLMNTAPENIRILIYHNPELYYKFNKHNQDCLTPYEYLLENGEGVETPNGIYTAEYFPEIISDETNDYDGTIIYGTGGWLISPPNIIDYDEITEHYYPVAPVCWMPIPRDPKLTDIDFLYKKEKN